MNFIDILAFIGRIFIGLRILFNPIWPPFSPFESNLLNAVSMLLKTEEKNIFETQIGEINSIDRGGADRKIVFYKYTLFSLTKKRKLKFYPDDRKWILIKCRVYVNDERVLVARFFIVDGNFFSIEFNGDADMYRNETNVKLEVIP